MNDIGNLCGGNVLSFADDTTLYILHSNLSVLFANANTHINALFKWFYVYANNSQTDFHSKQTKQNILFLRPKYSRIDISQYSMHIGNTAISKIGIRLITQKRRQLFIECIWMKTCHGNNISMN